MSENEDGHRTFRKVDVGTCIDAEKIEAKPLPEPDPDKSYFRRGVEVDFVIETENENPDDEDKS